MQSTTRRRLVLPLALLLLAACGPAGWASAADPDNDAARNAEALRTVIRAVAGEAGEKASSDNNRQFAEWLEQFPAADADGDRVLTQPEALAFVDLLDAMQQGEVRRDIEYGNAEGESLKLDIYLPPGFDAEANAETRWPAVMFIHGGGWAHGSRRDMPQIMQWLAARGYVTASIDYRLAPKYKYPAQVEDAQAALAWLGIHADEYAIDPSRVAVAGASAGGHLALMVGLMPAAKDREGNTFRPRAIVNLFGPADLTTGDWPKHVDHLLVDFLGGTLEAQPERYKKASPVTYIDQDDPPVLTLHGTKDSIVPFKQAQILHGQLSAAGVSAQLEAVQGAGHGWGEPDMSRTLRVISDFLEKELKPAR